MPEQDDHLPPWLRISTGPVPADATVLDGTACRTRTGLFTQWGRALSFPDYFGQNWDAFGDSLRDALAADGQPIVLTSAAHLLADEPPAQLATFLAALGDAAAAQPALRVVLHTAPTHADELGQRIREAIR